MIVPFSRFSAPPATAIQRQLRDGLCATAATRTVSTAATAAALSALPSTAAAAAVQPVAASGTLHHPINFDLGRNRRSTVVPEYSTEYPIPLFQPFPQQSAAQQADPFNLFHHPQQPQQQQQNLFGPNPFNPWQPQVLSTRQNDQSSIHTTVTLQGAPQAAPQQSQLFNPFAPFLHQSYAAGGVSPAPGGAPQQQQYNPFALPNLGPTTVRFSPL